MSFKLKNRRLAEYEQLISDFKEEIKDVNVHGITGPHLPGVGEDYEVARYKFAFCGMETYGWDMLSDFIKHDNGELVTWTDSNINDNSFLSWASNYHATFWGFILQFLAKFYSIDFNDLVNNKYPRILHSFIWANSNSIERFGVTSEDQGADYKSWEAVKAASKKFDDLNHIINSCAPKVVFIGYKDCDEEYFLNDDSLSSIYGVDVNDKSNFFKLHHDEIPYDYYYARDSKTHIFKLPHPRWMGLYSGIGIAAYVDSVINDLKMYSVWKELPRSVNDWKREDSTTENRSSIDYKRKLIALVAHALTQSETVMTGKELQSIFNMNGIRTQYGTEYGNDGGRGIYTVIRNVWAYYHYNCKDYQTAYEIARSFVNKNGEYAYY